MSELRNAHIEYVKFLTDKTGLSVSALAKEAGVADSTLTRFLSKQEYESLSSATLNKISRVAGYRSYEDYLLSKRDIDSKALQISDAEKFEIYESAKRLLKKKYGAASPDMVAKISQQVIEDAAKLNTNFISDSLIMYVIEKEGS